MSSFNNQINLQIELDIEKENKDPRQQAGFNPYMQNTPLNTPFDPFTSSQLSPFTTPTLEMSYASIDSPAASSFVSPVHNYWPITDGELPLPPQSLFVDPNTSSEQYSNQTMNNSMMYNPKMHYTDNYNDKPSRLTLDFSFLDTIHAQSTTGGNNLSPASFTPHSAAIFYPTAPFLNSPSFTDESCTPNAQSATRSHFLFNDGANINSEASSLSTTTTIPKKYPCPHFGCNRTFPRSYNLKSHLLCHSGQKPHVCDMCKAAFARKHDVLQLIL